MTAVRPWWRLLSAGAVLGILAVAVLAGLARTTTVSAGFAVRVPVELAAASSEPAAVEPGPIIAPFETRRATASFGAAAYVGGGTTLTFADIPSQALSAYQRAATVIDLADDRCHLDWELVAALGKVASDHGRLRGSALDERGVARPAVLGPRLTGRHGTQRVADTDAGLVDGAASVDRVVGPLMLLPATWSLVAVDGDSDGRRDPQDVDDAALAVSVFLCAGPGDLRNTERVREQVGRYHPGADYLRTVLRVRADYRAAGVLPTAESLMVRQTGLTAVVPVVPEEPEPGAAYEAGASYQGSPPTAPTSAPTSTTGPTPTAAPTATPTPAPTASATPTADPTADPSPTDAPSPTGSPTADPTCEPSATTEPTSSPTTGPDDDCTTDPSPTPDPAADPEAKVLAPGAAVLVLPGGAWLWRRRRRDLA